MLSIYSRSSFTFALIGSVIFVAFLPLSFLFFGLTFFAVFTTLLACGIVAIRLAVLVVNICWTVLLDAVRYLAEHGFSAPSEGLEVGTSLAEPKSEKCHCTE
ncbi:hypothetical protein K493DRAFT_320057 [Basidiobolus meristosporus CBS 931.73]|uniref:Uncharacterized protein n=1 Tax=Basidiobolus meristosporus CBS 931.73 TaxID=1314790 RepID=A0A1Y1XHA0_9FUNG|nr:hypothetical protein K493DRAFT_320057 [Basidiobolus meristosporus CBS 931.73]|eukprot:ORX84776.1 hypothetical protein K493DRAFT_320057 [Basidiobolus meristosporus CBS 931.73]